MLRPRVIPCLLLHQGGLVKTVGFKDPKYVGDPLNAVRIFNEKEVDELMVLDIDATVRGREPDFSLIARLAAECRMPLSYGGGVKNVDQFERIVGLGVEKVAVSSAAVDDPSLVSQASARVGSQSVVVVLDVKKTGLLGRQEVVVRNGAVRTGQEPASFAKHAQDLGAGEVVLNVVDRDGRMTGYDLDLVDRVWPAVNVPLTVLGGAGSIGDIGELVRKYPVIGAAAGSLFVFKGKYRAVLINYPTPAEREQLIHDSLSGGA